MLFHSYALVFANIIEIVPNYFACYFTSGVSLALVSYYATIVKAIMVPLSMAFLGLWTVRNIRGVRRVIPVPALSTTAMTVGAGSRAVHAKNRQLIRSEMN